MNGGVWSREGQADQAVSRILEAASSAFLDLGVSQAKMGDIARFAGCSRGTLYNYFKSRHELHLAYVSHAASTVSARIEREVEKLDDPKEKFVEAILCAVREVRADPGLSAWFEPGESGFAADLSRGSEVVGRVAEDFAEKLLGKSKGENVAEKNSKRLLARWFVRVILSLLTMPGENAQEERALVEGYAVAGILEGR
jgi:AcrR family transcriptional regulator